MTAQELARRRKVLFRQMVTTVRSVNGKALSELCPDLRNEFDSYEDAHKTISRTLKQPLRDLKTSRMPAGRVAVAA